MLWLERDPNCEKRLLRRFAPRNDVLRRSAPRHDEHPVVRLFSSSIARPIRTLVIASAHSHAHRHCEYPFTPFVVIASADSSARSNPSNHNYKNFTSSYKSFHPGFMWLINASFFLQLPPLILFSSAIASTIVSNHL